MDATLLGMEPYRLTDSPWFWGLVFSLMALAGIGLIASKFDVRQRQVEGRFLGRQQAAIERERRATGLPPIDLADAAENRETVAPRRIVPLWTLATAAGFAAMGSAVMLRREVTLRRGRVVRHGHETAERPKQGPASAFPPNRLR